jgi:hypothetical protein
MGGKLFKDLHTWFMTWCVYDIVGEHSMRNKVTGLFHVCIHRSLRAY